MAGSRSLAESNWSPSGKGGGGKRALKMHGIHLECGGTVKYCQCVQTLCNNSEPAKLLELGIETNWTQDSVSRYRTTIPSQLKCWNRVFKMIRLGPMCPDTIQKF